ncbi:scarecrow-like protein 33 [Lotus japonicus]|uniref:scarecrow-like protein 33 n=1 Tax=Lotus japonicus TaxID=34305 RepID=UPI002587048C|nr:scarecrow-like protein 33 [Lotus japonicus]
MDPNIVGIGYEFDDEGNLVLVSGPNHSDNLVNFTDPFLDVGPLPNPVSDSEPVLPSSGSAAADPSMEDTDFSETVKYISQILMEENFEQKPCMCYDPLSLQHTERAFYDALEAELPLSPNQHPLDGDCSNADSGSSANSHGMRFLSPDSPVSSVSGDCSALSISQTNSHVVVASQSLTKTSDGVLNLDLDSSVSKLLSENIFSDVDSVLQFRRGLEEASKFLPQSTQFFTGLESGKVSELPKGREGVKVDHGPRENSNSNSNSNGLLKNRKNHVREDRDDEERRSNKQSAVSSDDGGEISEMFDRVLLSIENVPLCAEPVVQESSTEVEEQEQQPHSSDGFKPRSKRNGRKKETVDMRTLLTLCAQAVSSNDYRTAHELLKQIRQHSYEFGDSSQRLAHYFASGLEARLDGDGTGTKIFYMSLKKFTAADYLKAYQVFISACPFKKFAHFFSNKMILKIAEKAETLHIIDFGILYGFQWPILIKILSKREGGPPKLRITGIEYPQAGFRPAERIEETGRRLASYCERFHVPFEYKALASRNWETIRIEDLDIKSNEILAVNTLVRFKNLHDETIEVNSPRNEVLSLIRKMNPDIFTQNIVNGSYNAPFFATRFKEALFHYSAMYDMFDTLISRTNEWRLMLEREFLGREIMNVVACEGFERVERPETYKQWQTRNVRAGFRQIPLDKEIMALFRGRLRAWYHKDFVFNEDHNWMLLGWKGRILYASTCWVPA